MTPSPDGHWVAVGVPMATVSRSRLDRPGLEALCVRAGEAFVALDAQGAAAWCGARQPARYDALVRLAGGPEQLADLVAARLLVAFVEGPLDRLRLAGPFLDVVPIPLSAGAGPDPDAPERSVVTDWAGTVLVRLGAVDYALWSRLTGRRTVRDAAAAVAAERGIAVSVLHDRLPALFVALLASRAVALDVA